MSWEIHIEHGKEYHTCIYQDRHRHICSHHHHLVIIILTWHQKRPHESGKIKPRDWRWSIDPAVKEYVTSGANTSSIFKKKAEKKDLLSSSSTNNHPTIIVFIIIVSIIAVHHHCQPHHQQHHSRQCQWSFPPNLLIPAARSKPGSPLNEARSPCSCLSIVQ